MVFKARVNSQEAHWKQRVSVFFFFFVMKYYYEKAKESGMGAGEIYICDHPLFNRGTLYKTGDRGLLVVQEHYNKKTKARWWGPVEPRLSYDIYVSPRFHALFEEKANVKDENGFYPAISVRKIMWALRMKPLKKEIWEMEI